MHHTRLLALLSGPMPDWFVKEFRKAVDELHTKYGEPYRDYAQKFWDAIVEGSDPADTDRIRQTNP